MPGIIEGPPERGARQPPLWKRIGWFVGIAAAASAATVVAAYVLRAPFVLLT